MGLQMSFRDGSSIVCDGCGKIFDKEAYEKALRSGRQNAVANALEEVGWSLDVDDKRQLVYLCSDH